MVQILPQKTNVGTEIGAGLKKGIESGADIAFQRGMLRKAFEKVSDLAKDPEASPLDRNLKTLEAFSMIPGSERYIGQVLPMLNNMAAYSNEPLSPNDPKNIDETDSSQDKNIPLTPIINGQRVSAPSVDAFSNEDVDLYEPYLGKNVKKYDPQEILQREYSDLAKGLPESKVADYMRKHNAELESAVDKISTKQNEFANYYSTIHPNMAPDDQRIAQKFYRSKEALKAPTNQEKSKVVDNFLDRYKALKTNISSQTPRSLSGKIRSDQEKEVRNQVQWLINEDQRDLAKQLITEDLGFGDAESERIINPPTQQQKSLLEDFEKFPELAIKVPKYGDSARYFQTYNKERSEKIDEYSTRLSNAIKPGTAKNPGLSLLAARDMAMDATGMSWVEFNDLVNDMIKQKKINLDYAKYVLIFSF